MGSVKEISVEKPASEKEPGKGVFLFSDRYSVFDWGEMPDHIEGKGAALCMLSAYFFDVLEKEGIKSHLIGIVEGNEVKKYSEISASSDKMAVKLLNVIKPNYDREKNTYDYSMYKEGMTNYLIPLEVIYRNKLPEGSSVFKRIKKGEISYTDLGLDHEPMPGESLDTPILDVSTKLEHIDRYIKWDEAAAISGLGPEGIENVKKMILKINTVITKECLKAGIDNIDGKFEFGIDENGEIIVVDVLGTPDECRFFAEDFHISKEAARRYYRDTQWAQDAEKAKTQYGDDWKEHVKTSPTPLPAEMKELLSRMYKAVANDITDRKFFEVPDLSSTIKELKKYAG